MTALPEVFRRAMELSLQNARQGVEMLLTANEKAWTATGAPQSSIPALVQEMTKLARSNLDANFRAAQQLTNASSGEEALRLYMEYLQERQTAFTRQLHELGRVSRADNNDASHGSQAAPSMQSSASFEAITPEAAPVTAREQSPNQSQKRNKEKARQTARSTAAASAAGEGRPEGRTAAAQISSQTRSANVQKTANGPRTKAPTGKKSAPGKSPRQRKS